MKCEKSIKRDYIKKLMIDAVLRFNIEVVKKAGHSISKLSTEKLMLVSQEMFDDICRVAQTLKLK